jgi:diadenosine tetraphosphate (Ap4A) HIT family hydrolase
MGTSTCERTVVELCSFCEECVGPETITLPLVRDFFSRAGIGSRVLLDTEAVFVVPSLGALMPGHILVLPKNHYYSVGEIDQIELREYELVVRESRRILREAYGHCSAFEHGCVEGVGRGGACIDHAHLHLLPLAQNLRTDIESRFGIGRQIDSLSELRFFFRRKLPYLYYEEPDSMGFAYEAPIVPSQFFRQLASRALGRVNNWDWKSDPNLPAVEKTLSVLRHPFCQFQRVFHAARS